MKKLIAIFAVLALTASSARADPTEDAAKPLQGTWIPVLFLQAGKQTLSPQRMALFRLTITKNKFVLSAPDGNEEGTNVLRPDKEPKEIDITVTAGPSKGRTFLGIYEVINGQYWICYDVTGKQRPSEFRALSDGSTLLAVYRR
jgi:uncharacterized protein (TIGR03067 family)